MDPRLQLQLSLSTFDLRLPESGTPRTLPLRPGNPRLAESGPRFPVPGRIRRESARFPIPDSRPIGNRKFPPRFPAKSGIGGTGIGDFRVWARRRRWLSLRARAFVAELFLYIDMWGLSRDVAAPEREYGSTVHSLALNNSVIVCEALAV